MACRASSSSIGGSSCVNKVGLVGRAYRAAVVEAGTGEQLGVGQGVQFLEGLQDLILWLLKVAAQPDKAGYWLAHGLRLAARFVSPGLAAATSTRAAGGEFIDLVATLAFIPFLVVGPPLPQVVQFFATGFS